MAKEKALCYEKFAKSYREIERQLIRWKDTERHSHGLIKLLSSPLEQLHACDENSFTNPPLCEFKDLKQRLRHKLLKQMECIMKGLQDDLGIFKAISDKISKLWLSCSEVYSFHSSSLPVTLVCERSVTHPSIADLLEWLSILEKVHRELYEDKIDVITSLTYMAPLGVVDKAIQDWGNMQDTYTFKITDIMEQVAVFLASQTN